MVAIEELKQRTITVCDKCLCASCWQGVFMCDETRGASTTEKTVDELRKLDLEHPCYWGKSEEITLVDRGRIK